MEVRGEKATGQKLKWESVEEHKPPGGSQRAAAKGQRARQERKARVKGKSEREE